MNEKKKFSINSTEKLYKKKQDDSIEKKLFLWRIIINFIFSLILISIFGLMWTSYSPVWKIFFFLTIWSFWSNTFYIVTITVIDILLYKGYKKCEKFNLFIRNDLIRIFAPFSISTIIIYWELVLLGDKFQGIGHSILDICKSFFMHGLVLIFICFDLFTSKHINKKNNCKIDIIIISIIMILHFSLVVLCKEVFNIYQYDFLMIADIRQMIASFIIIYGIVLNGYIIFYLFADNYFEDQEIKEIKDNIYLNEESGDKLNELYDNEDKNENIFDNNNKQMNEKRNSINNNKYLKSEDKKINNNGSIKEEENEEEDKKENSSKSEKSDNISDINKEIKNEEDDNDVISEKVSNISEIQRKSLENKNDGEDDFIKINSFN